MASHPPQLPDLLSCVAVAKAEPCRASALSCNVRTASLQGQSLLRGRNEMTQVRRSGTQPRACSRRVTCHSVIALNITSPLYFSNHSHI